MAKLTVGIIYDRPGWAYDIITDYIIGELPGVSFTKIFATDLIDPKIEIRLDGFDVVHFLDWHFMEILGYKGDNTIASIHSHRNRDGVEFIQENAGFITVSAKKMLTEFPGSYHIPNGINVNKFKPEESVVVGFAGKPDEYKGFHLVEEACKDLGLELIVAYNEDHTHESMDTFYSSVSCIFTPSIAEGFNMPALEALCSGKDVFTTATGIAEEIEMPRLHIIERNYQDIHDALSRFAYPHMYLGELYNWTNIADQYMKLYSRAKNL